MLKVGVAQVNITPRAGIHLSGNVGVHRPAQIVKDPLFSKALVLECDRQKVCFVALDLCMITKSYCDQIRKAAEKMGFSFDGVMVHSLQIHSAPSLGHFMIPEDFNDIPEEFDWLRGGDKQYNQFAVERIIESIRLANKRLIPVKIGVGRGVEGRVAFNRRAVTRKGTVMMPWFWNPMARPLGWTEICYLEGPMDPELGVVCFRTDSLHFPAILINYTCHPVVVYAKDPEGRVVSADWPGALARELEKTYLVNSVLVLNGACGNINPWNPFDPEYRCDHLRMGRILAETAKRVIERITFKDENVLKWKSKHLKIPIRKVDEKELEEARRILKKHPIPVWVDKERRRVDIKWCYAALTWSRYLTWQRNPEFDYEIQVFRIGNTAFVSLPGEPFVEGGLRIKMASPADQTYIIHNTNQYAGYIPTAEAFKHGGHEIKWSMFIPEALDMIVDAAIELLNEVFSEG